MVREPGGMAVHAMCKSCNNCATATTAQHLCHYPTETSQIADKRTLHGRGSVSFQQSLARVSCYASATCDEQKSEVCRCMLVIYIITEVMPLVVVWPIGGMVRHSAPGRIVMPWYCRRVPLDDRPGARSRHNSPIESCPGEAIAHQCVPRLA